MARRNQYTKVEKYNRVVAPRAQGKGDRGYRGFQCLNTDCDQFIIWPEPITENFVIACPKCEHVHEDGGSEKYFDFAIQSLNPLTKEVLETLNSGEFIIDHRSYVLQSLQYKYCVLCNTLKPFEAFDRHSGRATGRQSECNLCKSIYNSIKNPTRTQDQHREAAQKRRLYIEISKESGRINTAEIFRRFQNKCFCCSRPLVDDDGFPISGAFNIDHTLPVYYLWPATSQNATLLCREHNGSKAEKWPSEFYSQEQINQLAVLTGLQAELLRGPPVLNPVAVELLRDPAQVNALIFKYARYRSELIRLRNRVLTMAKFDFFDGTRVSDAWREEADNLLVLRRN
ncbi:hypothetical protein [Cupriavidus gilardii]|uniref:hypothetical protein n=1 Tax=Cupriavidus gilardii TaxID=82541 RepID=UPI001574BF06|nr:hypothetical protein [Cupriavidus gilardii]NSX05679.1 hypothetical protein [Cupriavidus gilardii]